MPLKDIYAIDGIKLTRNKLYSPLKYDDLRLIARYLGMTTLDLLTKIDKDLAKR